MVCVCVFSPFPLSRITTEGVDIVMDCLCGEECNRGYGLLKPMGKYILYGSSNVVTGETKSFFSVARSVSANNADKTRTCDSKQ